MWESIQEIRRLQGEMEKLFSGIDQTFEEFRLPFVELRETSSEVIVSVELPGVEKKSIKLDVKPEVLEVKAQRSDVAVGGSSIMNERMHKGYHRMIDLPHPIRADATKATFTNGVLQVVMPKGERKLKRDILIE